MPGAYSVAGLFAGIGGIESGLARHGGRSELLCEYWQPAHHVLATRFPDVHLVEDVRDLRSLPKVDLVSAGFPCTDLSQAGRMGGITGEASGLVAEVFRLIKRPRAPMLLLENVRNMLVLDGGRAMRFLTDELEALGYKWAYRLVDSRFTGVPQRRQRVIFLASRLDPRSVLFADEAGEPPLTRAASGRVSRLLLDGRTPRPGLGARCRPHPQGRVDYRDPVPAGNLEPVRRWASGSSSPASRTPSRCRASREVGHLRPMTWPRAGELVGS